MDEYYNFNRNHVPAFGSWDCNGDLPFTQCFESARQAGLLRCSYTEERDLYDPRDSTPAMIVVPRQRERNSRKKNGSVVWDCNFEMKEPPSPASASSEPPPKAVDEDLYKISPDLIRAESKRKGACRFFSSCIPPCLY